MPKYVILPTCRHFGLYIMGLSDTKSCSLCESLNETTIHLFQNCRIVKALWNDLSNFLQPNLILPPLTPVSAVFRVLQKSRQIDQSN